MMFTRFRRIDALIMAAIGLVMGVRNLPAQERSVTINVLVLEPAGRYVTGLDRSSFRVFEDAVEQTITAFSWSNGPISLAMVVNVRGTALENIQKSITELSRTWGLDDIFVNTVHGALFDSVYETITRLERSANQRKILYVISDRADRSSRRTVAELRQALRTSTIQVFAAVSRGQSDRVAFREMVNTTGGRYFARVDMSNLNPQALAAIRGSYELTYVPTNQSRDGGFRRIRVEIEGTVRLPELAALARSGYFAPAR